MIAVHEPLRQDSTLLETYLLGEAWDIRYCSNSASSSAAPEMPALKGLEEQAKELMREGGGGEI